MLCGLEPSAAGRAPTAERATSPQEATLPGSGLETSLAPSGGLRAVKASDCLPLPRQGPLHTLTLPESRWPYSCGH